jgi:paraquat-inducible protein A
VTIGCPDCGALEVIPPLPPRSTAVCRLCERDLEKTSGRSITAALACSVGTFLLLLPSNLLPLLRIDLVGIRVENVIGQGIADLWSQQWFVISGLTALLVIVAPFARFGLLSVVLASLKFGHRPPWLGRAFRWAEWLDPWGMTDVFLLASFVGYYRMIHLGQASVSVELGGMSFMAAGFLTMLSRAALDRRTVWRAVAPESEAPSGTPGLSCTICDLVQPLSREGQPCPRCGARLWARKPDAIPRTAALLVAAFVLFFPANILPMEISNQLGNQVSYTIFTGVRELFQAGLWPLGVLIFCTSILIPVGKIAAVAWCVVSAWRHSHRHLVEKTKIFRVVAELGRWSKTDPFTIVFFVPLMHFGALASARASWGATAFMLMTMLTMVASSTFDPRLMWDRAPAERT